MKDKTKPIFSKRLMALEAIFLGFFKRDNIDKCKHQSCGYISAAPCYYKDQNGNFKSMVDDNQPSVTRELKRTHQRCTKDWCKLNGDRPKNTGIKPACKLTRYRAVAIDELGTPIFVPKTVALGLTVAYVGSSSDSPDIRNSLCAVIDLESEQPVGMWFQSMNSCSILIPHAIGRWPSNKPATPADIANIEDVIAALKQSSSTW